ncbi:STAS domain-containing protein [Streptomyces sp. Ac-502]|uniref:STAS domain-containing protein n=1 Tax=Streptomyces sp. Ac-502 TaxID=3342801 RepID=UPI003862BFFE
MLYEQAGTLRQQVEHLALSPSQNLLIDLSRLTFCDSTGISALLAARRRAHTADAEMMLAAVPANTMHILHIVGLEQIFTIHPGNGTA